MVILVSVGNASACDIQFALQQEAKSSKAWFPAGGILLKETFVAPSVARV
jgi:hypothetical protein